MTVGARVKLRSAGVPEAVIVAIRVLIPAPRKGPLLRIRDEAAIGWLVEQTFQCSRENIARA
jgi:hypothetical protein